MVTEKAYNALRLAMTLQKESRPGGMEVRIFLMADAVGCALPSQNTPQGYYNIERMLKSVIAKGGKVKACGSCIDARGLRALTFIDGVEISSMSELAQWTVDSNKLFTF